VNIDAHAVAKTQLASGMHRWQSKSGLQQGKPQPLRIQLVAIAERVCNLIDVTCVQLTHVLALVGCAGGLIGSADCRTGCPAMPNTIPAGGMECKTPNNLFQLIPVSLRDERHPAALP
jgi:hypothetical protein